MKQYHLEDYDKMILLRNRYIKYDDDLKSEIIRLCNADKLDELKELIEGKLNRIINAYNAGNFELIDDDGIKKLNAIKSC